MSLRIFFILIVTTVVGMLAFPQPQQPKRRGESPGKIYDQVLMIICNKKIMRAVPQSDLLNKGN